MKFRGIGKSGKTAPKTDVIKYGILFLGTIKYK